jgi:nucleoside 2-deoxyribosyltransferase
VSLSLWQMGAAALCPHANTRFFQNSAPDEVWIEGTMELLRRCDAVVLVGPVAAREASSGTAAEVSEARRLNMPIFDSEDLHAEFRIKHWITEFVREMNP